MAAHLAGESQSTEPPEQRPVVQPNEHGYQPVGKNFISQTSDYTPAQPAQPAQGVPPAYYSSPPPVQQWSEHSMGIEQEQPLSIALPPDAPPGVNRDGMIIFSIVLIALGVLCACFCNCFHLVCSIPALVLSIMAKEDDRSGNTNAGKTKAAASLGLNIAAVAIFIFILVAEIVTLTVYFVLYFQIRRQQF